MEKLVKRRTAAKGWVTRQGNTLRAVLEKADSDIKVEELSTAIQTLKERLASLDELQTAIEVELEPTELDADQDEAHQFREAAMAILGKARHKLRELERADDEDGSSQLSNSSTTARLPKLELPKFKGEVTEWQSFWDQYNAHIGDTDMPDISKFTYLLSLLEGEAKVCVQGLALTSNNYVIACDLLRERYGRPERIIFQHVQALLNGSIPVKSKGPKYVSRLWSMRDEFLTHIRSLEALQVSGKQCETFLTPIILSRLPSEIRMEWARKGAGRESDLEWLLSFLQEEIQSIERSEVFSDATTSKQESPGMNEQRKVVPFSSRSVRDRLPTASALHVSSSDTSNVNPSCVFCTRRHKSEKCLDVLRLPDKERAERIKLAGVCFKCLVKGHVAKGCFSKCAKCGGKHNVLMCGTRLQSKSDANGSVRITSVTAPQAGVSTSSTNENDINTDAQLPSHGAASLYSTNCSSNPCTILQTARVLVVRADGGTHEAKLMFDCGSDRTYVSKKLVQRCKPKWRESECISYSAFGGFKSDKNIQSNVFQLNVLDSEHKVRSFTAMEVPVISEPLLRPTIPSNVLNKFSHVQLADDYANNSQVHIDILVGLDMYWSLLTPYDSIQIDEIVALKSVFGYVLSGAWQGTSNSLVSSAQFLCISKASDFDVAKFWDLESIGISPKESDKSEFDAVLQNFNENVQYFQGRYEVALPWKSKSVKSSLMDNENNAHKRLIKLQAKLDQNVNLRHEYYKVFDEYEKTGIIEEVPCHELQVMHPTYYMPHRPVVKEDRVSTKVRPVFDASAKGYNGVSLNDCLHTGPSLNPDLVEVLMRFRWPIAVTGDITKAFLQIVVKSEDRDVHRFLLMTENGTSSRPRHMRFLRVPFGNTSSPFLLNATIKHHLSKYPATEVIQDLEQDMYVDNWMSGADSVDEAYTKFCEAHTILSHASMSLTKWVSNDTTVFSKFTDCFEFIQDNESSNALGLQWCSSSDTFSFQGLEMHSSKFDSSYTKRAVLSIIAKIFDPLGLISPFVMCGKILFQEVWRLGLSWDNLLPQDLNSKVRKWVKSSEHFKAWSVNRCYFKDMSWKGLPNLELHVFGDASEKAYGACVFMRTCLDNNTYHTTLVASKSRVAPIKTITLPRLELMGALLCARLVTFVRKSLRLDPNTPVFCWTDSKIVLSWIQGDPHRWKMFVSNRVTEIQNATPPSCWHYCTSKDNPADLISRGVLANQLVNNRLWMNGPHWLAAPLLSNQEERTYCTEEEVDVCTSPATFVVNPSSPLFDLSGWSSFTQVIRVVAWVLRFVNNSKPRCCKIVGSLTGQELSKAMTQIIYTEQRRVYDSDINHLKKGKSLPRGSSLKNLDPILDDQGLLRIKGRLENADLSYESKHPIIIPKGHLTKLLIRFQHLFLKHGGVSSILSTLRANFWVMGGRRLAKSVIKECVMCQRHDSRPCNQLSPPLPEARVKATPPFTVTGIDFAGPLFCADFPSSKFYVLLFTCAAVRAIHLELTDSMSLFDCICAIRRFISRRGLPSVIYSDNFKTFVASAQKVQEVYGHLAPQWKFIAPKSPWWGGWWERLVRSVKFAMRKTLASKHVTRCELETCIHEVESCINSRPLTYVEDNPDLSTPLSPSHFLIGRSTGFQIHAQHSHYPTTSKTLCERAFVRKHMLDNFWKLWSDNYIRNLPPVVRNFKSKNSLKIGDVVLVKKENNPRLLWPLGLVVEVFPDKAGLIRTVKVKTSNGFFVRSVQNLYKLEISSGDNDPVSDVKDVIPVVDTSDNVSVTRNDQSPVDSCERCTRTGRVVNAPQRLDL